MHTVLTPAEAASRDLLTYSQVLAIILPPTKLRFPDLAARFSSYSAKYPRLENEGLIHWRIEWQDAFPKQFVMDVLLEKRRECNEVKNSYLKMDNAEFAESLAGVRAEITELDDIIRRVSKA